MLLADFYRDAHTKVLYMLLNVDHKSWQAPTANGHDGPNWDPLMCMAMAPPKGRECSITPSRANSSLAAPTLMVSACRTAMMSEVLA